MGGGVGRWSVCFGLIFGLLGGCWSLVVGLIVLAEEGFNFLFCLSWALEAPDIVELHVQRSNTWSLQRLWAYLQYAICGFDQTSWRPF